MAKIKLVLIGVILGIIITFTGYLFLRPTDSSTLKQIEALRYDLTASQERERQSSNIITELTATNNRLRDDQQQLNGIIRELNSNQQQLTEELSRWREEFGEVVKYQQATGASIEQGIGIVRELIPTSEIPGN